MSVKDEFETYCYEQDKKYDCGNNKASNCSLCKWNWIKHHTYSKVEVDKAIRKMKKKPISRKDVMKNSLAMIPRSYRDGYNNALKHIQSTLKSLVKG